MRKTFNLWRPEDPSERGTKTHPSTLAWKIPRTEEPGGLKPIGSQSRTRLKRLRTHADNECHPVQPPGAQPDCLLWATRPDFAPGRLRPFFQFDFLTFFIQSNARLFGFSLKMSASYLINHLLKLLSESVSSPDWFLHGFPLRPPRLCVFLVLMLYLCSWRLHPHRRTTL